MNPLFYLSLGGEIPVPCLDREADGTPRVPDGVHYFDLDGAAKATGMKRETLENAYTAFAYDLLGTPQVSVEGESESVETGDTGQMSERRFVAIEEEQRDAVPMIELKDINAGDVRERVRRRMAGEMPPELYEEFKAQMEDLGYDIVRRECYPVLQYNEDTKRNEVVCCATLAAVEAKVLASGLCDGWAGPTLFAGEDGELKPIWTSDEPPMTCQVKLRRKGVAEPCTIIMSWNECAQYLMDASGKKRTKTLTQFWRERPKTALEKCAKMKAMRTQFREFVGAVYAREELPELARRAGEQLVQRSSTLSGIRNRPLPDLRSTGHDNGSTVVEFEAIRTESAFRTLMRSRGLVQDFMIDHVIAQARAEHGAWEDEDPERFWQFAFDVAGKRYGVRI